VILTTAYLPPTAWFASANQAVGVYLEQHEHFQKGTIRNRCQIAGPNAVQTLSIPLKKGKNSQQTIRDVRIAYEEPWQRNHWRSIQAAYGSAPYFPFFCDKLEPFYTRQFDFLFDYNLALIELLASGLKLQLVLPLTDTYMAANTELLHDVQPYPQVFEDRFGFRGGLSALDLLMCGGRL
jgi:WbqC-like protein family